MDRAVSARHFLSPSRTGIVDILRELGETASALSEGRVFVGRRRVVDAATMVDSGDEVVVEPPSSTLLDVRLVDEWRGLVTVEKPPGLSTEPDARGCASVVHSAAALLRVLPVSLHAVTRLDASASGLVVLARGSEARRLAARLSRDGALQRTYLALTLGAPESKAGTWEGTVDERGKAGRQGRPASTRYEVLATAPEAVEGAMALLRVSPVTGRTHQIRIHASRAGAPLLGDVTYGGRKRLVTRGGAVVSVSRVMLHAWRVAIAPPRESGLVSAVRPPRDFVELWTRFGGGVSVLGLLVSLLVGCSGARYGGGGSGDLGGPTLTFPAHFAEGSGAGDAGLPARLPPSRVDGGAGDAAVRTSWAPDPVPLTTASQWQFSLVYEKGRVRVERVRRVDLGRATATARNMGRFAFELWHGGILLDRVRFDFPLLAADRAPTGARHPLHEDPVFSPGAETRRLIWVPASDRATRAVLVDRLTGQITELPWPPTAADAGEAPKVE